MQNGSGMLIRQYAYDQARKNPEREIKILSERELCKIYNVSRPTVRKTLDELVDEKILVIRKGLGTFTNPGAFKKNYFPGGKRSVGIVVGGGKNVTYDRFFWAIIAEAGKVICDDFGEVRLIQTVHDNEKAAEEFLLLNLDGVIWIHPTRDRLKTVETLERRGLPVICVDAPDELENISYVSTDFHSAGQRVAEYFLDKGHREILFAIDSSVEIFHHILEGCRMVFDRRKIDFDERLTILRENDIMAEIGNLSRFKIDFTACFGIGSCFWAAVEALRKTRGEKFRESCEMMATFSSLSHPSEYSFVDINPYELGRRAAAELFGILDGKRSPPVKVRLKPDIKERGK